MENENAGGRPPESSQVRIDPDSELGRKLTGRMEADEARDLINKLREVLGRRDKRIAEQVDIISALCEEVRGLRTQIKAQDSAATAKIAEAFRSIPAAGARRHANINDMTIEEFAYLLIFSRHTHDNQPDAAARAAWNANDALRRIDDVITRGGNGA